MTYASIPNAARVVRRMGVKRVGASAPVGLIVFYVEEGSTKLGLHERSSAPEDTERIKRAFESINDVGGTITEQQLWGIIGTALAPEYELHEIPQEDFRSDIRIDSVSGRIVGTVAPTHDFGRLDPDLSRSIFNAVASYPAKLTADIESAVASFLEQDDHAAAARALLEKRDESFVFPDRQLISVARRVDANQCAQGQLFEFLRFRLALAARAHEYTPAVLEDAKMLRARFGEKLDADESMQLLMLEGVIEARSGRRVIDVNYSCRSTTITFAGRRQVSSPSSDRPS